MDLRLIFTGVSGAGIMRARAGGRGGRGNPAHAGTGAGSTLADELARSAELHVVVHQAAGMIAVQLGIGVADALVRLRAHAFATGTPLHKLAEDVVDRRVQFDTPDGLGEER
jgi:ANTAR domain